MIEKKFYKDIAQELHAPGPRPKVINLWATWCRPCVKELPEFERFRAQYDGQVDVILVSLDFATDHDTRLPAFVKQRQLKSRIIAVQDPDPNSWVHLVNADWGGAIPATYVIDKQGNMALFHDGELDSAQLESLIKPLIESKPGQAE